mgnify:CR=1 FL=1
MEPLPAVLTVVFAAGLVQGLAGFGSALVAVPLLALLLPLETVVPLMALIALGMSGMNVAHLHRSLRLGPLAPLLAGYLAGTPLGLYFLVEAPRDLVLGSLGLLLVVYGGYSLTGRDPRSALLRRHGLALGAASGALGAAFSTNGPPVILHVTSQDWEPRVKKAVLSLFFFISSTITAAAHALAGLTTGQVLHWALATVPALILGTLAGIGLYRRLSAHDYRRITFALVLVMGLVMLGRAVVG